MQNDVNKVATPLATPEGRKALLAGVPPASLPQAQVGWLCW